MAEKNGHVRKTDWNCSQTMYPKFLMSSRNKHNGGIQADFSQCRDGNSETRHIPTKNPKIVHS